MSRNLKLHITGLVVAGVVALVATSLVFPGATGWPLGIDPRIALPVSATEEWNVLAGVAFWCAITLAAPALPVVMPRGSVVSVSLPPIVASMILGGPVAAGWVAAIGSTELREVRGEV